MVKPIEHITITTGATRMSAASEVEPQIVAQLVRAIRDGQDLGQGWTIQIEQSPAGSHQYTLAHMGAPIVRCWLCVWASASAALWETAIAEPIDESVVIRPPRGTPWLAAEILPSAITAPASAIMAAGDLERCVAWALLAQ